MHQHDDTDHAIEELGQEPPLVADGRSGPPDRREISARWLSGTFLTGITSTILMGVALYAALEGSQTAVEPVGASAPRTVPLVQDDAGEASKTARLVPARTLANLADRRRLEISTMTRDGDREIVRTQPFVQVAMALAAGHAAPRNYPPFDPLEVFAEDPPEPAPASASTGVIYGARVESEVSLMTSDFPLQTAEYDLRSELTADEVETVVRNTGAILTDGDIQVAAMHYVDPQRFGNDPFASQALGSYGVRVVPENMSVAERQSGRNLSPEFAEDIIPIRSAKSVEAAFADAGYGDADAIAMSQAIAKVMEVDELPAGTVLRVGIEVRGERSRVMRASVYSEARHELTLAVDDDGRFVPGDEPEPNPAITLALEGTIPAEVSRGDLPTTYDAIYRASASYGLTRDMTRQLIRLFASDVDYQARIAPTDRVEVFFSQPDAENNAGPDSQLLYVSATFGGAVRTYYRFQMEDGTMDFFDEEGRSARPFLLRNPVPSGRFTSGFGMRRHPILGYSRMHTGVDWSAPRGTPIIAAGSGVIEKAGWSSGYGRQTLLRHANGYVSSYNHQSALADGIREGARVRQGQVIGYVGATGLATGNHLHYELIVNGTKVDPMRVRLPNNRSLETEQLEAFQYERRRIEALLNDEPVPPLSLAATN